MAILKYLIENLSGDISYVYVGSEMDLDSDEYDIDKIYKELEQLQKKTTINILSDKEINTIALNDGSVVGALWTAFDGKIYSFDVVVDPAFEGKGIGSELTNIGMSEFYNYDDAGARMELYVVNPRMEKLLAKKGFRKKKDVLGGTIMTYRN